MHAAVLKKPGQFQLEEVEIPRCPNGGLLIKVQASSICGADVKMINKGHKALRYPRIPGHEVAGIIVENKMANHGQYKVGTPVQIAPGIACNSCTFCRRGAHNLCPEVEIIGFTHDGGFAEYLVVPPRGVVSGIVNIIPEHLSFAEAALAEPLACCINGQQLARVGAGDVVLIVGAGAIGHLHAMLARANGAKKIILGDIRQERLDLAELAGVDKLVNLNEAKIQEVVHEETGGTGVDVVLLACSQGAIDYPLLQLLAPRGRISLFSGLPYDKSKLNIDLNEIHYRELMLVGAYGCSAQQNKVALELMATGKVDVKGLITGEVILANINKGLENAQKCLGLKTIINFREAE